MVEAWKAANEIENDPTPRELAHALRDNGVACVLGWPELTGEGLARRGDIEVRVIDVFDEGTGLVRRLLQGDSEVSDVPMSGLGSAVAASSLLLLEASVVGPEGFVAVAGSHAAAAVARHAGIEVWLVAGLGRLVPGRIWDAVVRRVGRDEPWECEDEIVPLDLVDRIVRPRGTMPVAEAIARPDCPVAAELLREL
jgi:hypothetical protein